MAGMARRRMAIAGAVLGAAALLSSCAASPGDAAVIDGHRITTTDVTAVQKDLQFVKLQAPASAIVGYLALAPTVDEVAKKNGAAVSDDQAKQTLIADAKKQGIDASAHAFAPATLALYRGLMEQANLQGTPNAATAQSEIEKAMSTMDVKINPRFRTTQDGSPLPGLFPWLVGSGSAA